MSHTSTKDLRLSMLVKLLGYYYRSGWRGSFRLTQLINRIYPLTEVRVPTAFGTIVVDLTLASGQGLVNFQGSPQGSMIENYARGICYDIGAHFGIYSVLMARRCEVYAFEPNRKIFTHLQQTAANRRITPFNVALSDSNGTADFFVPEEATMGSLVDWTHDQDMNGIARFAGRVTTTSCDVHTLDDFVDEKCLPLPNFVKVDVEGAEIRVFRGARKTIERSRPIIYFEVSAGLWNKLGASHEEGFEFFRSLGYKLFRGGEELENLDLQWDDVLAVPQEQVPAFLENDHGRVIS